MKKMKTNEENNVKETKIIPLVTKVDLENKTWVLAQNGEWVPQAEIKPEYRDIPDDEWVSLDPILPKKDRGRHWVNKLGWRKVLNIGNKSIKIYTNYPKNKYVIASIGGKGYPLHVLIAKLFIINPDNKLYTEIDHINGDKSCNKISNLRWCSTSMNNKNRPKKI